MESPTFITSERQVRCCTGHASYDELTEHLVREFGELRPVVVAREVARAAGATEFTGLRDTEDGLLICELIARQQLQLLSGHRADAARLDPQVHPSR